MLFIKVTKLCDARPTAKIGTGQSPALRPVLHPLFNCRTEFLIIIYHDFLPNRIPERHIYKLYIFNFIVGVCLLFLIGVCLPMVRLPTHGWRLLTCRWCLLTHGWHLLTHGFRLLTHGWRLLTCSWRLLTDDWPTCEFVEA